MTNFLESETEQGSSQVSKKHKRDYEDHDVVQEPLSKRYKSLQRSDDKESKRRSGEQRDANDNLYDGVPSDENRHSKSDLKKKHALNDSVIEKIQDIFGVDFNFEEIDKYVEDCEKDKAEDVEDSAEKKTTKSRKKSSFDICGTSGQSTDFDNEVCSSDMPERMQLRSVPVSAASEEELISEAQWIYDQAFERKTISIQDAHLTAKAKEREKKGPQTVAKITMALDFMRNQNFEVPFISFYRKEYVLPELSINDLWKVYEFDAKWCQLRQHKQVLLKLFRKMKLCQDLLRNIDAPLSENSRPIEEDDIKRLENVDTTETLNDCYHHFMLHYSHEVSEIRKIFKKREKGKRRSKGTAKRKPPLEAADGKSFRQACTGLYSVCLGAGLQKLTKKFGLSSERFAKNLTEKCQTCEFEQQPTSAKVLAIEYIGDEFQTTEEVLKSAQLMVAIEIASEPLVRESVRKMYKEKAKISVRPTDKGIKDIDENHPVFTMKYLKDKPIRDLAGDQYLKLVMAQDDKLISIHFSDEIEGDSTNNYVEQIKQLYSIEESSKNAQSWNALRLGSIDTALTKMLIPDLKKELHWMLLNEAKDCVMRSCTRKMYNWIKSAPYHCDYPDKEWDVTRGLRIMSLAYASDSSDLSSTFACMIGPDGKCTDYLKLAHLRKRGDFQESDKNLRESDLLSIKKIIATKKPHVVAIGGESIDALAIVEDVKRVISSIEKLPSIAVEIVDDELAVAYSRSQKGISEFRDYPEVLRQAISLARRLQDPLVEFSQLCNAEHEILDLKFHSLQNQLTKADLMENICLEFVNRVNEVGVDVNKVLRQPYFCNLLQFVCGLGPRKGQNLIRTLKQTNQQLENRNQLVELCQIGPKVFANCVGFIKIDANNLEDSSEVTIEVLDCSRVHPESYVWAEKIATDALDYEFDKEKSSVVFERILESPEKLSDLNLDAFAEELQKHGFGNKCVTLYDIRSELVCRYKDLRLQYQSPTPDKLFEMLTKESPENLRIGKLVEATIIEITYENLKRDQLNEVRPMRNGSTGSWQCPLCLKNGFSELSDVWNHLNENVCPGRMTCIWLLLDNGIPGYIVTENAPDKHEADSEELVSIGNRIQCRIVNIEVDTFTVELTGKSSDLVDKNHKWRPPKDPYYDSETEAKNNVAEEDERKTERRPTHSNRTVNHPAFRNINYSEAEVLMQTMQQGEVIIRPSSKGDEYSCVTWKVTDDVHQHIAVREENKCSLWVGNQEFKDFEEIITKHVNPMVANASELLKFKYYKPMVMGMKDIAEEVLKGEKKKNPNGIPYIISVAMKYPGRFMLSYLPRTQCWHDYISVTPDGFKLRGHCFSRVNDLFRWFKEHSKNPTPEQLTPIRQNKNQEKILAQSMSPIANHTPPDPQTPSEVSTISGYGINDAIVNTSYTQQQQTPYHIPRSRPIFELLAEKSR